MRKNLCPENEILCTEEKILRTEKKILSPEDDESLAGDFDFCNSLNINWCEKPIFGFPDLSERLAINALSEYFKNGSTLSDN